MPRSLDDLHCVHCSESDSPFIAHDHHFLRWEGIFGYMAAQQFLRTVAAHPRAKHADCATDPACAMFKSMGEVRFAML